ncbi:MAG: hypothetical protein NVSMB67_27760 [Flavisolibacter sp.]
MLISLDNNFSSAKRFKKFSKLILPIFYPRENLPALFNTGAIPATFIFNEKGELIKEIEGGDDYNTDEYRKLLNS